MSMVINVHDDLARRLREAAARRCQSVEDVATTALEKAFPRSEADQDWGRRNQRRLELIRQSTRRDLTLPEQVELDELQSCLDERFAWFDAGLLHQLEEMKQAVQHLPTEPPHE